MDRAGRWRKFRKIGDLYRGFEKAEMQNWQGDQLLKRLAFATWASELSSLSYRAVLYVGRNWSNKRIVDLPFAGLTENCRKPD